MVSEKIYWLQSSIFFVPLYRTYSELATLHIRQRFVYTVGMNMELINKTVTQTDLYYFSRAILAVMGYSFPFTISLRGKSIAKNDDRGL